MKTHAWLVVLLLLTLWVSGTGWGQTYEATMELAVSGNLLNVDLFLQTTGGTSAQLGDATFTINYNKDALTYQGKDAASDGRWDNGTSSSYNDLTSSNVPPRASLDVTKNSSAVSGSDIPFAPTRIGRIVFVITNNTLSANIGWNTTFTSPKDFSGAAMKSAFTFTNPVGIPLPITLTSFSARTNPSGSGVRVEWGTVSEVNNYGFYVQRREEATETFVDLPNSFVAGHGTTLQPQDYSFVDNTLTKSEKYYYRLRQVDLDGTEHYSSGVLIDVSVLAVKELAPMEFKLHQNYPNPFNPEAVIKFSVESTGKTTLRVYNVLGQEVATLFEEIAEAGQYYKVRLNGTNLASGVYFYKLESGKKSDLRKMLLLK